ncbi:putative glycolipid-binding domain-containing protein [Cellulomonas aerilata]|uniref:Glycolipid-binding domain-containing protein n=1 Tax=Cellulomonas aerilata TaxID=515326 RepID=A0A512DFT0_9CELL|nr:putative glycolipid-binding domain-containing protein [Cellulomonas aerilata]GEO35344.1 hypothetical protein CAE01nite_30690 [Cellulomonas aerilata]
MAVDRLLVWRGVDPDRVDAARVTLHDDRLHARGTSLAPDHTVTWRLVTGPGWTTRVLDVRTVPAGDDAGAADRDDADADADAGADDGGRRLVLRRDDAGRWSGRRWVDGRVVAADLPDPAELAGALDCDLGLCPLTNTMPVLRSGLLDRADRTVRFTVAWVSVPDLTVHVAVQDYGPAERLPSGGAVVHFDSDGFTADLTVDREGLVVSYPGIADRITDRIGP